MREILSEWNWDERDIDELVFNLEEAIPDNVLKKKIKRANKNSLAVVLSETMEPIGHILNHYLGPEFIR